ncbi:MAG: hypothetical protein HY973_04715 [Candidatus Kerfeldbacteria bacterium]|nr:hypothetical protein [Candidatus Kerfeldbacteria bacterium]
MKEEAIGPWFIETPKDQREYLNNLIKDINSCLTELTMPPQSNVAIYIVLDKYGPTYYTPANSTIKLQKPIPNKIIIEELKNSYVEKGWSSIEEFHYNGHSLCFEIVNNFISDKPLHHFYLIQQDSKGFIKPTTKLKESPKQKNSNNIKDASEKFIG